MHIPIREIHIIGRRSREWRLAAPACPAMRACGLLHAGWTAAAVGYRFTRIAPPFHGLIACDGGRGRVLIDGQWRLCERGQAYLLPAGVVHAYEALGAWSVCWVAFEPRPQFAADRPMPVLIRTDPRPLRAAIEGLQREVNGVADASAVQQWLALICLYAMRISRSRSREDRLFELWERLDADLGHRWTLEEMADLAAMSGEHLRRLCQRHYGRSPVAHLTHLRMRRAAALLVAGGQKIAAVARAVGYENAFAFSTCFKRHLGVSPVFYRDTERDSSTCRADGPTAMGRPAVKVLPSMRQPITPCRSRANSLGTTPMKRLLTISRR